MPGACIRCTEYDPDCATCLNGKRAAARKHDKARRGPGYQRRRPIEEVAPHVETLLRYYTAIDLGHRIGVDENTIARWVKRHRQFVNGHYAAAILAIQPPAYPVPRRPSSNHKPAFPSRRKLRSLARVGYGLARLADECGLETRTLWQIRSGGGKRRQKWVTRDTHDRIDAMWRRLPVTPGEIAGADTRAIRHAEREGWPAPICWDVDDIEQQGGRPRADAPAPAKDDRQPSMIESAYAGAATFKDLTIAERVEVLTTFVRWGWSDERIAVHLRWAGKDGETSPAAVCTYRRRHHVPDPPRALRQLAIDEGKQLARYLTRAA